MKTLIILSIFSLALLSCKKEKEGCTDSTAFNYHQQATIDNGSCSYRTKFVIDKIRISDGPGQNVSVVYRGDTILATFIESMTVTYSNGLGGTSTSVLYAYELDNHITNGDLEIDDQITFLIDGQTPYWYYLDNYSPAPHWFNNVHVAAWLN